MVQSSESLPGVVTSICSTHEVFNDKPNVDETDAVIRGQVSLQTRQCLQATTPHQVIKKKGRGTREHKNYTVTHKHITKIHIKLFFVFSFGYKKKTWLSDSPWSRSNWTLDILAWKEHTMSVSKTHGKQEQGKWGTQKLSGRISLPVFHKKCFISRQCLFWII